MLAIAAAAYTEPAFGVFRSFTNSCTRHAFFMPTVPQPLADVNVV